jgi:hypothetical protein
MEGEIDDDKFIAKERNHQIHAEHKAIQQEHKGKATQPPPEPYVGSSAELHGR